MIQNAPHVFLKAEKDGYLLETASSDHKTVFVRLTPDILETEFDLQMQRMVTVSGKVPPPDGGPVAGAKVLPWRMRISNLSISLFSHPPEGKDITTSDGLYSVQVQPNRTVRPQASAAGWPRGYSDVLALGDRRSGWHLRAFRSSSHQKTSLPAPAWEEKRRQNFRPREAQAPLALSGHAESGAAEPPSARGSVPAAPPGGRIRTGTDPDGAALQRSRHSLSMPKEGRVTTDSMRWRRCSRRWKRCVRRRSVSEWEARSSPGIGGGPSARAAALPGTGGSTGRFSSTSARTT